MWYRVIYMRTVLVTCLGTEVHLRDPRAVLRLPLPCYLERLRLQWRATVLARHRNLTARRHRHWSWRDHAAALRRRCHNRRAKELKLA